MSYANSFRAALLASSVAVVAYANPALAQSIAFDVPAQPAGAGIAAFAEQADIQILVVEADTRGRQTHAVRGTMTVAAGLAQLIEGSGLSVIANDGRTVTLGARPQDQSAGDVDALIVTAQKREEAIQDVPIAISAFSQKSLEEQKIEGGFDLLKAIPNVTFSKSNFTSYNFSIRGIGTKAISATTDPGVAVAFNNTPLIQNRLFEQEYFDVERVEVLRGPQGTLYGRNATAGVINVISAKPDLNDFKGSLKLEGGNYDARRAVGMVNIPIIEDVLAVRLAGSMTQRTGYDYNSVTGNNVNGRDLWSLRATVAFEPTENIRANFIWERFEEDDDRSRTGKQLCHRDPGPTVIGNTEIAGSSVHPNLGLMRRAAFGQGCKPGSLYSEEAFGTPNGMSLPFVLAPLLLGGYCGPGCSSFFALGTGADGLAKTVIKVQDPYGGMTQSRDLRTIASFRDPKYDASADLLELNVDVDLTDALTFTSQTAYNTDTVYSFQDYNRFNTLPVFEDSSLFRPQGPGVPNYFANLTPGGVFCDPQLGCSDTIAGFDISQADGRQFSQEFRLQSDFEGPVNFSIGANYTRFETVVDYYVFYNLITALAMIYPLNGGSLNPTLAPGLCTLKAFPVGTPLTAALQYEDPAAGCPYIDPNPIESINGEGHNYFRSKNPYKLRSAAAFGEIYWNINEDLKLTAGLRYTDDLKTFTPVPSQVLLAKGILAGGTTNRGYPEKPPIEQQWGEFTGRIGLDWKPVLPFTDQTMVYGFYSRGYKGGGANPPSPGFATGEELFLAAKEVGVTLLVAEPVLWLTAVEYGRTFDPEFVNAFEVGAKNTLLGGAMTFNLGAFYYDYTDYQVSQIRDRTAVNENFDATVWGLEFETTFQPSRNLKINANLGYLDTEIAEGEASIDIMNRTQGDPRFVVAKPWIQLPSNCVLPVEVAEQAILNMGLVNLCGGVNGFVGGPGDPFDFDLYPELNRGAGVKAQLGGNELPNSPHWTANAGAQYGMDIPGGWRATVRGDVYWQSQSFARVYNAVNDKLKAWTNANLSVWVEQPDWGLKIELYAKNIFDDTPITDAFLNSDDTALTTNVFVLDPRIVGLSVRKDF